MNQDESARIHELCSLIAIEHDREKFIKLVEELNSILSAQNRRLQGRHPEGQKED